MSEGKKFVKTFLVDNQSYILEGYPKNPEKDKAELYQFEYKVQKSEAVLNMELLQKGLIELPRWLVYVACIIWLFLLTFFIVSLTVLGSIRPDSIYGESCAKIPCAKALNLKCINKTCLCESPKYYSYKCVDLSKYGESCVYTSNCDPTQSLTCLYSTCGCASTKYWSSTDSKCLDRKIYGLECSGDECKINSNLVCNSVIEMCDCIDSAVYYWNGSTCVTKKTYGQTCTSDIQCLDSQLTICDGTKCTCYSTQYYDTSALQCKAKVGEGEACSFDGMCISPMYCSSFRNCSCSTTQYFDEGSSQCIDKYLNGVYCTADYQCRSDLGLYCISNQCSCLTKYTWYSAGYECKLTYSYSTCTDSSDCNPSENLVCTSSCTCPSPSGTGICDCNRVKFSEYYWSGTSCVSALTYGSACTNDYECQTLTQGTFCNTTSGLCDCAKPGGYSTIGNRCKKCLTGETYFNDKCYFISTESKKHDNADDSCDDVKVGGIESTFVSIESVELNEFISTIVDPTEKYWTSGEEDGSSGTWSWRVNPRINVDNTICPLVKDKDCIYFLEDCFYNDLNCDSTLKSICQRPAA